jgi:hypothetical protein
MAFSFSRWMCRDKTHAAWIPSRPMLLRCVGWRWRLQLKLYPCPYHVLGFEYDLRYLAATKVRWYDKKYQAGPFYVEMLFD